VKEKVDRNKFVSEIQRRNIDCLIHFTPTINLMSMCEQGHILSRQELKRIGVANPELEEYVEFNDSIRLDKRDNYINMSVMFPNHFLLSRFREKSDYAYMKWCVIRINPKYIYAQDTLFSVTNAASNAARNQFGINGTYEKFIQMFSEQLSISSMSGNRLLVRNKLPASYPTCVQAEVLVLDKIPMADILEVCFVSDEDIASTKAALKVAGLSRDLPFSVNTSLFGKRG
jgi:hypothetical protein